MHPVIRKLLPIACFTLCDLIFMMRENQIAAAAKVATVPTGEVVMVCCENSDAVMNAIKTALAA